MLALVFPLPAISRFSVPEPFKGKQFTTWALIHGTPLDAAQNILLEGFIRPANWSCNCDHSKCDVPTFGAYYLGLEIGRENKIPEWAARDLMDRSQKRGKGQQKVLIEPYTMELTVMSATKAEEMKWPRCQLPTAASSPRQRSTRLRTAIMWDCSSLP